MSGTKQDYEHTGTVNRNDTVVTDDGDEYHIPPTPKRREEAPLHTRRVAFDSESTFSMISDRVIRWVVIDSSPSLETSGEVVYTHYNSVFVSVDGYENDIQAFDSDFYGNPEVGDTVLFDWHSEGERLWKGEVAETDRAETAEGRAEVNK